MMKCGIKTIDPLNFGDGIGIRVLVEIDNNQEYVHLTPNELVDRIRKFRPYFELNNGGVTFKSNNLNNNIKYLAETCHICHKAGINTCINTNGLLDNYSYLLKHVDYVVLFIDSIPEYNYNNFSKEDFMKIKEFITSISDKKVYVKHILNEQTSNADYIYKLKKYISCINNIKNVELIQNGMDEGIFNKLNEIIKIT